MKNIAPLFSYDASGSLGPLTYRTLNRSPICQMKSAPTGEPSTAQSECRSLVPLSIAALRHIWAVGLDPQAWGLLPYAKRNRLPAWQSANRSAMRALNRDPAPWLAERCIQTSGADLIFYIIDLTTLEPSGATSNVTVKFCDIFGSVVAELTESLPGDGTLTILAAVVPATAAAVWLESDNTPRSPYWTIPEPESPIPALDLCNWFRPETLVAYANEDEVQEWPDSTNAERCLAAPFPETPPLCDAVTNPSFKGLTFDGQTSSRFMRLAVTEDMIGDAWTFAFAVYFISPPAANSEIFSIAWKRDGSDASPSHHHHLYFPDYGGSTVRPQCEFAVQPANWQYLPPSITYAGGEIFFAVVRLTAEGVEGWWNGNPEENNPGTGGLSSIDVLEDQVISIGCRNDYGNPASLFTMFELIRWRRALSNAEVAEVNSYLADRYA